MSDFFVISCHDLKSGEHVEYYLSALVIFLVYGVFPANKYYIFFLFFLKIHPHAREGGDFPEYLSKALVL